MDHGEAPARAWGLDADHACDVLFERDLPRSSRLACGTVSENDIADLLRRNSLRVTPQRRAILQAFRGASDEHLSADEVISRASVAVPEIGRGTVYATLAEFAELGVLGSVGNPEPIRYETNVVPQYVALSRRTRPLRLVLQPGQRGLLLF